MDVYAKVRICMKSTESQPIENEVQVDEFVIGGKEEKKQGRKKSRGGSLNNSTKKCEKSIF